MQVLGREEMDLQLCGQIVGTQTGNIKQWTGRNNYSNFNFCTFSNFLHKLEVSGPGLTFDISVCPYTVRISGSDSYIHPTVSGPARDI